MENTLEIRTRYGRTHLSCLWKTITNDIMSLSDSEVAFIAFISTFIILSFLSNVSVVVVLMKIKTMRTVTNMFLTTIAVSDMILVSAVLPLQVHDISHANGYDECKLHVACPMLLRWRVLSLRYHGIGLITVSRHRSHYGITA